MSSYVHFFVRKDNVFCPIGTFTRNSGYYQAFCHYLPYEKCRAIPSDLLITIRGEIKNGIKENERYIKNLEESKKEVSNFNNSVEEKIEAISDLVNSIQETEAENEELKNVYAFTRFLDNIMEEAVFTDTGADKYVYGGIECPEPTIDDLVE
jgi:threonine synthase